VQRKKEERSLIGSCVVFIDVPETHLPIPTRLPIASHDLLLMRNIQQLLGHPVPYNMEDV
jgi:hypothetical protein